MTRKDLQDKYAEIEKAHQEAERLGSEAHQMNDGRNTLRYALKVKELVTEMRRLNHESAKACKEGDLVQVTPSWLSLKYSQVFWQVEKVGIAYLTIKPHNDIAGIFKDSESYQVRAIWTSEIQDEIGEDLQGLLDLGF
jgi:hypothetical protein